MIKYNPMCPICRIVMEGFLFNEKKNQKANDKYYIECYANHLEEYKFPQGEVNALREIAGRMK